MRRAKFVLTSLCFIGATIAIARAASDNNYLVTVLVSNQAADHAPFTDTNLVNAWGITATSTSPWWVSNNGTGTSTIYRGDGSTGRPKVTVPGAPTGIVAYTGTAFLLAPNRPARFICPASRIMWIGRVALSIASQLVRSLHYICFWATLNHL